MKNIAVIIVSLVLVSLLACSQGGDAPALVSYDVRDSLARLLAAPDSVNAYAVKPDDAPDSNCSRLRVRQLGGPFGKIFNDSNYRHLAHAVPGGIRPVTGDASAWYDGKGLVLVRSDRYIFVDSLSHSYPYLVPHAAGLLEEIGKRFADSLAARGGGSYRPKVTSLLRTPVTIGRLRRVNGNATVESAHQYATTFDISYSKFICDNPADTRRTFEDLKNLLAEIVFDLRAEGRCLVKHERRQACFHITATIPQQ